jgi:hypothetical protein
MLGKLRIAIGLMFCLAGCQQRTSPPPTAPVAGKPAAVSQQGAPSGAANPAEDPPAGPRGTPLEKFGVTYSSPDESHLPLQIHLDARDVPAEIARPSPPIREKP